jgi:branched-chain amino acid transport system ATP-binding protein
MTAMAQVSRNATAVPKQRLLSTSGIVSRYGPVEVLHGLDIQVFEGQIVAIVGANGAGKSTFLRVLSGIQPITKGSVSYAGQDVTGSSSSARVRAGICQVPEGRQMFGPMTVEDNLRLGAFTRAASEIPVTLREVFALFPVLEEKRALPAGTLSGGQQQMLAIGRALMSRPRLLLLDEPSMGLAPLIVREIFGVIRRLKVNGLSILLVEQNARAALRLADWGYVIETGRVSAQGDSASLLANEEVRRAYLGI